MDALFAITLIAVMFLLPLALRARADRRQELAERVTADIRAAVNRRLRGESLLSVTVRPAGFLSPGRVVLDVPNGYQDLAEAAWPVVAARLPADYELVVKARRPVAPDEAFDLPRAA